MYVIVVAAKIKKYRVSENPNLIKYATREAHTDGKRSFAALRYLPREAQKNILGFCTDGKQEVKAKQFSMGINARNA